MKTHQNICRTLGVLALTLCFPMMAMQSASAEPNKDPPNEVSAGKEEREIINLSKEKWQWMAERDIDTLTTLFHDKAMFVHMGGSMSRQQELDVIKSGGIHYKKADIHEVSVNVMGTTAILLNRITLLAVVGGKEVTNPFMVTEVYKKQDRNWKLASMSFTKLLK